MSFFKEQYNHMPRQTVEQQIKPNRLFILGAGFSAAAGVPLTNKLLPLAMEKFRNEYPGLFARVDNYAHECVSLLDGESPVDHSRSDFFQRLCTFLEYIELREYAGGERWSDNGSREKLALRYFLAKTLAEHTPEGGNIPELYIRFAEQLHAGDIIITFNWDGLLENALNKVGKPYTYDFSGDASIKLCKLHGSINWRLGKHLLWEESRPQLSWSPLDFSSEMMSTEIYATTELLSYPAWKAFPPFSEVDPFLVLPGYGKAFDVRSNAALWYKPEFAFGYTHDVYIIGMGLSKDDFFVRSLFLSNLPFIDSYSSLEGRHIFIINPDERARKNYAFILSSGNATFLQKPFSIEDIKFMEQRSALYV